MREIHKRDIVLKTDAVTNKKYWSSEVVTVYKPDEADRLNAVLDILQGVTTAEEVRKEFDIATVNSVYTLIGKYVTQQKAVSLEEQTDEDMSKKSKDDQTAAFHMKDLHACARLVDEDERASVLHVETHLVCDDATQRVETLAHVRRMRIQEESVSVRLNIRYCPIVINWLSICAEISPDRRTVTPLGKTISQTG